MVIFQANFVNVLRQEMNRILKHERERKRTTSIRVRAGYHRCRKEFRGRKCGSKLRQGAALAMWYCLRLHKIPHVKLVKYLGLRPKRRLGQRTDIPMAKLGWGWAYGRESAAPKPENENPDINPHLTDKDDWFLPRQNLCKIREFNHALFKCVALRAKINAKASLR